MKELNKNNPFKTPEGYFDGLNDRLMDKLSEESSNIPKKEGFTAPKDYFESLNSKILNKIDDNDTTVIQLNPFKKYYYAVASIAAILLMVFGFKWGSAEDSQWDNLATADIESYLLSDGNDISVYDLNEALELIDDTDDFTEFIESDEIEYFLEKELENLNIEDYEIN